MVRPPFVGHAVRDSCAAQHGGARRQLGTPAHAPAPRMHGCHPRPGPAPVSCAAPAPHAHLSVRSPHTPVCACAAQHGGARRQLGTPAHAPAPHMHGCHPRPGPVPAAAPHLHPAPALTPTSACALHAPLIALSYFVSGAVRPPMAFQQRAVVPKPAVRFPIAAEKDAEASVGAKKKRHVLRSVLLH
jgi:hypothetical protein